MTGQSNGEAVCDVELGTNFRAPGLMDDQDTHRCVRDISRDRRDRVVKNSSTYPR